jgi:hypothetical protein
MIPFTKGYLGLSTLGQIHGSALPRTLIPGLLSFCVTLAMFYIPSNDPLLAASGNKTWRHYWIRLMPDWKVSRRLDVRVVLLSSRVPAALFSFSDPSVPAFRL